MDIKSPSGNWQFSLVYVIYIVMYFKGPDEHIIFTQFLKLLNGAGVTLKSKKWELCTICLDYLATSSTAYAWKIANTFLTRFVVYSNPLTSQNYALSLACVIHYVGSYRSSHESQHPWTAICRTIHGFTQSCRTRSSMSCMRYRINSPSHRCSTFHVGKAHIRWASTLATD